MTTNKLISELSARTGLTKNRSEQIIKKLAEIIIENTIRGEKTSIVGFGTFDLGTRAARRGVNPQTGAEIHIPEMPMPRFRAGNKLKSSVRSKVTM